MSASSLAASSGASTAGGLEKRPSYTMSPTDEFIQQATSTDTQIDDDNLRQTLDKGGLTGADIDTILVQASSPEITLPKTALISALEASLNGVNDEADRSKPNAALIRVSSNSVEMKPQLKSISNIVQSNKSSTSPLNNNNMCTSSTKVVGMTKTTTTTTTNASTTTTTTVINNRVKDTSSDLANASNAPKIVSIKSSKGYFKDPTIIKPSSGHHHNNVCLSKPLVINHSPSAGSIIHSHQMDQLQPIIPTLSSQLLFSSIITTQAKPLSSVQVSRAKTPQLQQQANNLFSSKTALVMNNRSASASSLSSPSPTSSLSSSTTTSKDPISGSATTLGNKLRSTPDSFSSSTTTPTTGNAVSAKLLDMGKKLLDAAREGHTDQVRQLVVNSGAPFTSDWLGTTALHLAAQYGHIEIAEILLRGGVNRDARTKLERTALHLAAQGGWLEVVDLLLLHGSDVNVRDMLKMTPLHWAVERGHVAVVERLLFSGADTNAKSKFHLTPIDIAQNSQSYEMLDLFRNWIHKGGSNLVSYVGLSSLNKLGESHEVLDFDCHQLNLETDNATTTSRNSILDIDEPCIDLVELEWSSLKFEPDFFLSNEEEDEPNVEYLMKIVEELQKENRQLRQRVEQLSTTSQ